MWSFPRESHCFWFCVFHINVLMPMLNYYIFVHVSVYVSISASIYLSIYLSIYIYIYIYICIYLVICLFSYLVKSWVILTPQIPIELVHFSFSLFTSVFLFFNSMTSWFPIHNTLPTSTSLEYSERSFKQI